VTASAGNKDSVANVIAVPQVTHAARVRPLQGGDLQEGDPGGNPGKSEPSRVQTVVQGINVPDAVKIHIWTKPGIVISPPGNEKSKNKKFC